MKNISICIILFFLSIFLLTDCVHAKTAVDKLCRGAINIIVSSLEVAHGIHDGFHEGEYAINLPVGLLKGAWNGLKRVGAGLYDVIIFPIPIPRDYAPIIEDPKFLERKIDQ